jgi:hypothetical protein
LKIGNIFSSDGLNSRLLPDSFRVPAASGYLGKASNPGSMAS